MEVKNRGCDIIPLPWRERGFNSPAPKRAHFTNTTQATWQGRYKGRGYWEYGQGRAFPPIKRAFPHNNTLGPAKVWESLNLGF
eukprot:scaffold5056_cov94-Isochrysis_galbana.AAC.4